MTQEVKKNQTASQDLISNLQATLLSTLDERVFFSELIQYLGGRVKSDEILVYLISDDHLAKRFLQYHVEEGRLETLENQAIVIERNKGIVSHLMHTKRPYFSNLVHRDPVFVGEQLNLRSSLCLPILHEGTVMATIHLNRIKNEAPFMREDITGLLKDLKDFERPIGNMNLYLNAKRLNDALLKKIQERDREMETKDLRYNGEMPAIHDVKFMTSNPDVKKILEVAQKVAKGQVNITIEGSIGTGKETLARYIHRHSERKDHGFVIFDCSLFKDSDLEAELFGIMSPKDVGRALQVGILEKLNRGTLVLKNIEHIPFILQSKILNFIREGHGFARQALRPFKSSVRFIVLTSFDLNAKVQAGIFRQDFLYGLNMFSLQLPELRERSEDIEALAEHFLSEIAGEGQMPKGLSYDALKIIKESRWETNLTELRNALQSSSLMAEGMIIEAHHLPTYLTLVQEEDSDLEEVPVLVFEERTLEEMEKRHICLALEHLRGNKTRTAKVLGITVKTLYNKLHTYGMLDHLAQQ